MKRKRLFFLFLAILVVFLTGCGEQASKPEKIKDIEYTVLEEGLVPEELLKKIKEKQEEPFRMTYETEGYLYIAEGFGTQPTSGYSVRMLELYESPSGIVFSAELLGPAKDEPVLQVETYPFIVIKLPAMALDVLFQ